MNSGFEVVTRCHAVRMRSTVWNLAESRLVPKCKTWEGRE